MTHIANRPVSWCGTTCIYKELGLKGRELSIEEFASLAAEHPRLLQRPIVIKGEKAILGQPAELIDKILN